MNEDERENNGSDDMAKDEAPKDSEGQSTGGKVPDSMQEKT